ncbi:MAG: di-trans,poly-cis-decaprenylcistransferase [Calditrichia bacterium]
MKQSFQEYDHGNLHVAIIMDGNGRWASLKGKPRFRGHRAGAERAREIIESAPENNISVLTLYAFSSDNWQRPRNEVDFLMNLFRSYLESEVKRCLDNDVRLSIIGRRDRLNDSLLNLIDHAESATFGGSNLHLRVAIDYSARDAILQAAQMLENRINPTREEFSSLLDNGFAYGHASPDVDLLIRTGGEKRLSDFLLWECAYAELYFTNTMWPDFDKHCLKKAVDDFYARERRFGRVPEPVAI